jgi:hypothetical protein
MEASKILAILELFRVVGLFYFKKGKDFLQVKFFEVEFFQEKRQDLGIRKNSINAM